MSVATVTVTRQSRGRRSVVPATSAMEAPMKTVMEVVVEAMMETVIAVEREYVTSDKPGTIPAVPRIAPILIPIIAIAAGRQVLHSITAGVHALRVGDVVACLEIVLAGRNIGGTDRSAPDKACGTANRRTGARVSGRGADGRARRRPKHGANRCAADRRAGVRLRWLMRADCGSRVVAALPVVLLERVEALSARG